MAAQRKPLWADTPFALISETGVLQRSDIPAEHAAVAIARQMAQAHNAIIRALNSVHNQCTGPKRGSPDAAGLLEYCQIWHDALHSHHEIEERVIFPDIEAVTGKPGLMAANVQQHRKFDDALEDFRLYVFDIPPEQYEGAKLLALVKRLGPILTQHLHDEIPTLLDLYTVDDKKLKDLHARANKAAQAEVELFKNAPLLLGCTDKTFLLDGLDKDFLHIPFFASFLVQNFFSRRHSAAWKFHPCTFSGIPRPLYLPSSVN